MCELVKINESCKKEKKLHVQKITNVKEGFMGEKNWMLQMSHNLKNILCEHTTFS